MRGAVSQLHSGSLERRQYDNRVTIDLDDVIEIDDQLSGGLGCHRPPKMVEAIDRDVSTERDDHELAFRGAIDPEHHGKPVCKARTATKCLQTSGSSDDVFPFVGACYEISGSGRSTQRQCHTRLLNQAVDDVPQYALRRALCRDSQGDVL